MVLLLFSGPRTGAEGRAFLARAPLCLRRPLPRPGSLPHPPVGPDRADEVREARLVFRGHRALRAPLNHAACPAGGAARPRLGTRGPAGRVMCSRAAAGAAGKVKLSYRSF